MTKLYSELATVYEAMYQSFIDYKAQYEFYSSFLQKYNKRNVLEIGCGTGHLAKQFTQNGYNYTGLDYSADMIKIAKERFPLLL